MANRTLIPALVLSGLLCGCEKDQDATAVEPEPPTQLEQPREPMTEEPAAEEPEPTAEAATEDFDVLPALGIIGVTIDCTDTVIYFETDSSEIQPTEQAILDNLAACLMGTPYKEQLEITGRADPRGPERYNKELSEARAQAVADYLKSKGVKEDSFEIRARGEKGAIEGMPALWPMQRRATVEAEEPITP